MKIPEEILSKYSITDEDTAFFIRAFDEPENLKILEVGAHDEPVANMLTDCGHSVIGVDLREYNPNQDIQESGHKPECNYTYLRHDFCDLPVGFIKQHIGTFDVVISISAIEHFGLGTYGEGNPQYFYDVLAVRQAWQLLKEKGVFYLTVPFGGVHRDNFPHWRIYDQHTALRQLVQDFTVERCDVFIAGPIQLGSRLANVGDPITWSEIASYTGNIPHLSLLLKLRKSPKNRLAPDGR